jgi:hypothetical protein
MLGAQANSFVQLDRVGKRTRRQARSKLACRVIDISLTKLTPVGLYQFIWRSLGNISRKEHLQGAFARLTPRTHNISRMKAERKQGQGERET